MIRAFDVDETSVTRASRAGSVPTFSSVTVTVPVSPILSVDCVPLTSNRGRESTRTVTSSVIVRRPLA